MQPNDAPPDGGELRPPARRHRLHRDNGQTWGTVYDTINYTTTGALGDWFDSSVGLNADGIDNEMSFSHLDKNINFDPHTEQLHVDGNKSLIYAHLAEMLAPTEIPFQARGTKGYVANERLTRAEKPAQLAPEGTSPQPDIDKQVCTPDPASAGGRSHARSRSRATATPTTAACAST